MNYTFHFAEVWEAWEELALGAAQTLRLSVLATPNGTDVLKSEPTA